MAKICYNSVIVRTRIRMNEPLHEATSPANAEVAFYFALVHKGLYYFPRCYLHGCFRQQIWTL